MGISRVGVSASFRRNLNRVMGAKTEIGSPFTRSVRLVQISQTHKNPLTREAAKIALNERILSWQPEKFSALRDRRSNGMPDKVAEYIKGLDQTEQKQIFDTCLMGQLQKITGSNASDRTKSLLAGIDYLIDCLPARLFTEKDLILLADMAIRQLHNTKDRFETTSSYIADEGNSRVEQLVEHWTKTITYPSIELAKNLLPKIAGMTSDPHLKQNIKEELEKAPEHHIQESESSVISSTFIQ